MHFDAHLDLMDDFMGIRYSHANPMKRIAELEHIIGLTQIGIRGLLNGLLGAEKKAHYFTAEDVRQRGEEFVASQIPQSENIYISVDIDCLDPSVAPGTGTPEPGGLTYLQLRALLRACAGKGRLVGMDLVEVNPLFDPTGITANVAARLILDALGAAKG
ncbi:MAG: arginase family protein [Betaproteobacteria bacterium]|nr:arginase family protein [Betaproteobacteria bacterium]